MHMLRSYQPRVPSRKKIALHGRKRTWQRGWRLWKSRSTVARRVSLSVWQKYLISAEKPLLQLPRSGKLASLISNSQSTGRRRQILMSPHHLRRESLNTPMFVTMNWMILTRKLKPCGLPNHPTRDLRSCATMSIETRVCCRKQSWPSSRISRSNSIGNETKAKHEHTGSTPIEYDIDLVRNMIAVSVRSKM